MMPGDICLASFPFGDAPGMKLRPVLLLSRPVGPIPEILVGYISSVVPAALLPTDMLIDPSVPAFQSTHLKTVSVLRLHKLATIHVTNIVRRLGALTTEQRRIAAGRLEAFLEL
jgi:hypothetical protein